MISVYDNKIDCCGCSGCEHICPTKAIAMDSDSEGFKYPVINTELCIDCGKCREVCAFQKGYDISENFDVPLVYAVKHKNEEIRGSSTSGGAFTAISDKIIESGGIVYGVTFDSQLNVVHKNALDKSQRDKFKGSKYVQSDIKNTFSEIYKLLKDNNYVLFSGTPCQVAGLNSYLKMKRVATKNLLTLDIVCHGTPSPLIWKEHIKTLEQYFNMKVTMYYFRPKIKGWHTHNEIVMFEDKTYDSESLLTQTFRNLFYSHNILRPSCHNCKYTNLKRPSDITIADFWGIEKSIPEFDDNKGVSLVLANTVKGQLIFDDIKSTIQFINSNTGDCLQPQLQKPSSKSDDRDTFWEDYYNKGYYYVLKKFAGYNLFNRTKNKFKKLIK